MNEITNRSNIPATAAPPATGPFQFSLRTLLWWMFLSSVYFAAVYWLGWPGAILGGLSIAMYYLSVVSRGAVLTVAGCGIALLLLLVPTLDFTRPTTRRDWCQNNLRQVHLALLQYHATYGSLPPAYIADESGQPMHSWRVLILPYLGRQGLYEDYSFDEPWDGPNNRKLHNTSVDIFHCPSDTASPTNTSYVVVVGPGTLFPNEKCTRGTDITDRADQTLLVVEVRNSGIHWMEPRDLHVTQMATTINPPVGQGISSSHISGKKPNGAHAAFADGSTRYLSNDLSPATLRAMLTIAGGEKIDPE